jgi:hypothetical protein
MLTPKVSNVVVNLIIFSPLGIGAIAPSAWRCLPRSFALPFSG